MSSPKKVFVSYNYKDVVKNREGKRNFRDELINILGDRGLMHKGENEESFDMCDYNREQIIEKISPYIKKSSITVILLTPNAYKSDWIPWEISLSLRERTYKDDPKMTRNGIIGVYLPLNYNNIPSFDGDYSYYKEKQPCGTLLHFTDKLPKMVQDNAFNLKNGGYVCKNGCCNNVYDSKDGSYIELVDWDDFIDDIPEYIERAWQRRNNFEKYDVRIKLEGGK